jgi:hypothetical protein
MLADMRVEVITLGYITTRNFRHMIRRRNLVLLG